MPDHTPVTVRLATTADADAVADTLAAAFMDYPWTAWALPEDNRYHRIRTLHYLYAGLVGAATGTTWVSSDLRCAAQWIPPIGFEVPDDLRARLRAEEPALVGDRADLLDALDARTAEARPKVPHWWLATIGTHPAAQRRGLGSLVLQPVLAQLDARGQLAALETSSAENERFYARLGFETADRFRSPDGGLDVWVMVRRPRAGAVSA